MVKAQIVITAASNGRDSFLDSGRSLPKNLTPFSDSTILSFVVDHYFSMSENITVAISQDEALKYHTDALLKSKYPKLNLAVMNGFTAGAMCTALLSIDYSEPSMPLIVAPGDSLTLSESERAIDFFIENDFDAGTIVFDSSDKRFSYVRVDQNNQITEIAEKRVISNVATTGLFYFKNIPTFFEGAKWALINSTNLDGQYFVSHSFHKLLALGCKTSVYKLENAENYITLKSQDEWDKEVLKRENQQVRGF